MSRIGWKHASVGDVGSYINGMAFKPSHWQASGRPIVRIQNLTDPSKPYNYTTEEVDPKFVVRHGHILVSWSATLDAFVWRGPEAVLNQHIFKVEPNRSVVTDGFLFYQLKRVIEEMWHSEHTHGSTMKHINRGPFLAHPFWIAPLDEQHRIVAAIETHFSRLDAAVASLTRAKANVKRARASVLKAAVEGRLVPTEAALARAEGRDFEPAAVLLDRILAERKAAWASRKDAKTQRGKYEEPVKPETEGLPGLPEGWCWATVDQAALSVRYGTSAKCSEEDIGVPVLRMGNIVDGQLDLTNLKYLPVDHGEFPEQLLAPGELLFNRTNSAELVGKCAIYKGNPAPCACASYLIRLTLAHGVVEDFLSTCINSVHGRLWVKSVVNQQVGQANVNGTKLRAHAFPLPPLAEQHRIVAEVDRRLSVLDALDATLDANLARCARLRQSVLKRAFEGRLVPAEANAPQPAAAPQVPLLAQGARA